jgi:hypothetical protein
LVIGNFNNGVVIRTVNLRLLLRSKIGGGARSKKIKISFIFSSFFSSKYLYWKWANLKEWIIIQGVSKSTNSKFRANFFLQIIFRAPLGPSFHTTLWIRNSRTLGHPVLQKYLKCIYVFSDFIIKYEIQINFFTNLFSHHEAT